MALWLKCLLLCLKLSLALSGVIVLKLDDEEDTKAIAGIIESKIDKQEEVLEQLKGTTEAQDATIELLNSTFKYTLHHQQEQIDNLTTQNEELKSDIAKATGELKQLKQSATGQDNTTNSTFYQALNAQQEQIKQLDDQSKQLKQDIQNILDSANELGKYKYSIITTFQAIMCSCIYRLHTVSTVDTFICKYIRYKYSMYTEVTFLANNVQYILL